MLDPLCDYIQRIENEDIPRVKQMLQPLEAGSMRLGSQSLGEEWRDVTRERIETLRRELASYETILARLKERRALSLS